MIAEVGRRHCVLGISGSLRSASFSTAVLHAVATASATADWDFTDIGALPHFNQDLFVDPLPAPVVHFREQIAAAQGVVISSSEYNHGVPGTLKNALDWASRPHNNSPFAGKPFLVITSSPAATGGVRAQYQLREAMISMLGRPVLTPEIVVVNVAAKMTDGRFADQATVDFALAGMKQLYAEIARNESAA